jgi:hemerythrin-like domain-containing protein
MAGSSLLPGGAPDFSDPLGLLRACHDRILGHCCTLVRLAEHLHKKGLDREARDAMARIHRYFTTAGAHHHCDEEEDLFPRLRGRDPKLDALMDDLIDQHRRMDRLWEQLGPILAEPDRVGDPNRFESMVDEFVKAYRQHVVTENTRLLPAAEPLIPDAERRDLGRAMAARRGVKWAP